MTKLFLHIVAGLLLTQCSTPNGPSSSSSPSATLDDKAVNYSLGEVVWVVNNQEVAKNHFDHELLFTSKFAPFYSQNIKASAIPFANGTALRLASSKSSDDVIARLISDSLTEREGIAFIGIKSSNLDATKGLFQHREIPFVEVKDQYSRAIFFPDFPRLRLFYFYENLDNPISEPVGQPDTQPVIGIEEAWIAVDDFYALENDFSALGLPDSEDTILQPFRATAKKMPLKNGGLYFVQREHLESTDKQYLRADSNTILGVSLKTNSIEGSAKILQSRHKINFATTRYNEKSCILIPPKFSFGSWLEFARPI